jgi:rhamnosyltransferase
MFDNKIAAVSRPAMENICAVVVTYNPDLGLMERMARIVSQVKCVVVIDNGSNLECTNMLRRIAETLPVDLISNQDNLGIATALNQGAEYAIGKGYAWLLTLDQDSILELDMLSGLQHVYDQLDRKDTIGIIAANFSSKYGKRWKALASSGRDWIATQTVITSGSLLSLSVFRSAGRFRDDFFIDQVDREYSLRLLSMGYKLYMTTRPLMHHAIGMQTCHDFLGIQVIAFNHSVIRRYYIARNRLALARIYLWRYPGVAWSDLRNMMIETIVILLYESNKKKKLLAIGMGLLDGLQGKMGKKNNLPGTSA